MITLSAMGLFVISAPASSAPTDKALAMALNGQHADALTLLTSLEEEVKSSYEYRYAYARILSWSGEFEQAGQAYQALQIDYPNHSDVEVSAGYLELFRGNLDVAEQYFLRVADQFAYYEDAQEGLRRVARARQASLTGLAETPSNKIHL